MRLSHASRCVSATSVLYEHRAVKLTLCLAPLLLLILTSRLPEPVRGDRGAPATSRGRSRYRQGQHGRVRHGVRRLSHLALRRTALPETSGADADLPSCRSANVHSHFGPVLNPAGPVGIDESLALSAEEQRVAGGSSGGSAAAVAAGLCDVCVSLSLRLFPPRLSRADEAHSLAAPWQPTPAARLGYRPRTAVSSASSLRTACCHATASSPMRAASTRSASWRARWSLCGARSVRPRPRPRQAGPPGIAQSYLASWQLTALTS